MLGAAQSTIYPTSDLAASRAWFVEQLGLEPHFDEPFYVGFSVGGYELGLNPGAAVADGPITYWTVTDVDAAFARLIAAGAVAHAPVVDVGEGIRLGAVREPGGSLLGVIENPNVR